MNIVFFMEEMQKYDCLYNKYSKSYKDKYIKINCWTKIGEKFDMSAADAEKKFEMSSHRPTVSNMNPVEVDSDEDDDNSVSEQGETNKKTKIQRQRRSYGNTVSLPSLKTNILCQTRFSTTVAIVATEAIIWKPGLRGAVKGVSHVAMLTKRCYNRCE